MQLFGRGELPKEVFTYFDRDRVTALSVITRQSQLIFRGAKWGHGRNGKRQTRAVTFAMTCRDDGAAKLESPRKRTRLLDRRIRALYCTADMNRRK